MRIPHREQLGVVTSHQEVTEWHLEELRRRTAEEQFGELFAGAPDGMVLVDATGSIVLFNRKAEQLFGRSRQDTVGQPVEVLVPPDLRSVHHQHVRHFAEMNLSRAMGHSSTPLLGVRADGTTFPIEVSLSPLGIASGLAVMAAVRDVSDRMRLEDELRQSQRLETVGRLAGGVAHDFSNLLSVINGTAEMAQLDLPDDSPVLKDLAMIRAAGERAASLIQQLLAFSRRQVVQPALLQLSVVVRALEPLLQRLIGESINVRTQLTSEEWPVYLDPTQADQVLLNLATNARDAMPAGGELTITVANVTLDADATVKAIDLAPGQYVALTVTDTGVGMDEPTRTRIFEPFFTTKTRAKGTGLGLATVFGIAKQCGGSVSCEMSPRGGTTFLVLLPRAPEPGTARSRSVTCPAALSCPSRG